MSIISYAQNYEDVMLHRALKDVDKGCYIDVGANDPVADSVTKAFYDAGWRGVNIEPVSEWFEKLQQDRPDDINLQLAVSARKGTIHFYEVPNTGLSTSNKSIAKQYAQEHGVELKSTKVSVVSLTAICEQYVDSDIHFLKIDVEGSEKSVLQGFNLKKFRPWIILIESTVPGTQLEKHEDWEHILLAAGYEYIKFDGLNRFYVDKEHEQIKSRLIAPPNVFDGFVLSGTGSSSFHVGIAQIRASLEETEQQCQQLDTVVNVLQAEAAQHGLQLSEKEAIHQETLLAQTEKEAELKKFVATVTDSKQQIDNLQVSLAGSKAQQQAIAATLQDTQQQCQQREAQVQVLQAEATQYDQWRHEKETIHQEILLAQMEKETELQKFVATVIDNKKQIEDLRASLAGSKAQQQAIAATLQDAQLYCQQREIQIQTLQTEVEQHVEWLREKDELINGLNDEREDSKNKIEELTQSNHQWWSMADQHSKELEGIRVELVEVHNSSHHWNLEADRLDHELRMIYRSKFWVITWPLRVLMQLLKGFFLLPIKIALWLAHLPKRSARWSLMKARTFVLKRPKMKVKVKKLLMKYPNIYSKLGLQMHRQNESPSHPESAIQLDATPQVSSQPEPIVQSQPENNEPEAFGLESEIITASRRWATGRRLNE